MTTKRIKFDVVMKDKVILIDGFSGAGKSAFVAAVEDCIEMDTDDIQADLPYFVVSNSGTLRDMQAQIEKGVVAFFIADEVIAYKVLKAALGKQAYCILVTRKIYSNVNISYRSLYRAKRNEQGVTVIEPRIKLNAATRIPMYDVIITEDSKAGFAFVKEMVRDRKLNEVKDI